MADLKDNIKTVVVHRHACFVAPSEIQAEVKKDFGLDLSIPQILYYDPSSAQSKGLAAKWVQEYDKVRAAFLAAPQANPLANPSFRLQELLTMYRGNSRNIGLRTSILDQAGKEEDRIEKRRMRGYISMSGMRWLLEQHAIALAAAVNECIDEPELQDRLLDAVEARWNEIPVDPKRIPVE